MIAVLRAGLGHLITLGHDLQTGGGVVDSGGDNIPPSNVIIRIDRSVTLRRHSISLEWIKRKEDTHSGRLYGRGLDESNK